MNLVMSKIINLLKNQKYLSAEKEIRLELVNNPKSFDLNKFCNVLLWQENIMPFQALISAMKLTHKIMILILIWLSYLIKFAFANYL